MDKRRFILSIIELFLSIAAFFVVSLAWFAISTEVNTSAIPLSISGGVIEDYELNYYTYYDVFRYDQDYDQIEVYTQGFWNPIDLNEPGIYISEYDPILTVNNEYNNIFIELHLIYNISENTQISLDLIADSTMASNPPLDAIYLSEVSFIQFLNTSSYALSPEGSNLYNNLTNDFNGISTSKFYDIIDVYTGSINYENITLDTNFNEIYIYFSISYDETRIESVIDNSQLDVNNIGTIIFYQDIKIVIREVEL